MKNRLQILELYKFYKNKLDKYKDRNDNEIGYVTEKQEVIDILKLLEDILEEKPFKENFLRKSFIKNV